MPHPRCNVTDSSTEPMHISTAGDILGSIMSVSARSDLQLEAGTGKAFNLVGFV